MECNVCGTKNNANAKFCQSCGSNLKEEKTEVEEKTEEVEKRETEVVSTPVHYEEPKKNKTGIIIGAIVVVIIVIIALTSGSGSGLGSGGSGSARTRFGEYLVSEEGFTRESSTKYTKYYSGYILTIDFVDELMSMENSTIYSAYYYKTNRGGVAVAQNGSTIAAIYDLDTGSYRCEATPSTNQDYVCNYIKASVIKVATSAQGTFESLLRKAGVSARDL